MKNSIRTLFALLAAALAFGCSHKPSIEGRVEQVTVNTLTITTTEGELITFVTADAEFDCHGRLHKGSPVSVSFSEEPKEGFGTATQVTAPDLYNRLIGIWTQPDIDERETVNGHVRRKAHGINLLNDGEAATINPDTLFYESWSADTRNTLTLCGRIVSDGANSDFCEVWTIERLEKKHLTLRRGDEVRRFVRAHKITF